MAVRWYVASARVWRPQADPGERRESVVLPSAAAGPRNRLAPGPLPHSAAGGLQWAHPSSEPSLSISSKFWAQRAGEGLGVRGGPAEAQGGVPNRPSQDSLQGIGPSPQRYKRPSPSPTPPPCPLHPTLSHPHVIKEQDTGMTMLQNILCKCYNEAAGGALCTGWESQSPPPQHRRTGGAEAGRSQEQGRKDSTWGSEEI